MRSSSLSSEARHLMYGVSAIRQHPEEAEQVARALGISDKLEAMRASRQQGPQSYVYLVDTYVDQERYYKIGKSVAPHIRLTALRTGYAANMPSSWEGQPLRPLALRLGDLSTEASIHADLRSHRLPNTEWFIASLAVNQYIVDQDAWNIWGGEAPNPSEF